jgi:RNA polymerase sigma-70 factor (ECF subfamily)
MPIRATVSRNPSSLHIFEMLARQNEPMLLAYVFSIVADPTLAEDIAQQTFLIAYRKIDSLKDPAAFPAWLRGIARLESYAALRKRGREFPVEPDALQELDEAYRSFEDEIPGETWEERFRVVERCFGELPETLQTVCRLHYFENRKAREIAGTQEIKLNAVLKRLERARTAIRDCVQRQLAGGALNRV